TLGDRFTPHARILDYFHLLTTRSNLITMQQFGETYEHRPLMLAVITSPKNRAALDTIRANVAALTDPNATSPARANEIARTTPAVAWLAFGVHGNESSSAEASMNVASTLLNDPQSAALLENLVVIIDPSIVLRNDSCRKGRTMARDGARRGEPDLLAARRNMMQRALEMS
ncbi:MAG: M14 family zinc carboxypeptidase, partial [Reyranella sp.]